MRTFNPNSISYTPGEVPSDPKDIQRYLRDEFAKISSSILALSLGHLDITNVVPTKPRDGDIRYADGVNWQPNGAGGIGIWYYKGSTTTWVQLG